MPYVIRLDEADLNVPVDDLGINRVPSYSLFWSVNTRDLAGIIRDDTKEYFQISFTSHNIKTLVTTLLDYFKKGQRFTVITPQAKFENVIIHEVTIDDERISVSLIAPEPSDEGQLVKSNICLATEVNYRYARPGFVNFYQFGNYFAISTFPFKLSRNVSNSVKTVFKNDYWSVFEMPVSEKPKIISYTIKSYTGYCFTHFPELMTKVIVQCGHGNRYTYAFGVHPSCELSAYLQVKDLKTGEVWFRSGNRGTLELAPGRYVLRPIVVIPERSPELICGPKTIIDVPDSQTVLSFYSPLTIPLDKTLDIYAAEDLILHFEGWKTIPIQADTLTHIKFDYPGTLHCRVYSQERNMFVTSFTVNIYDISIPSSSHNHVIRVNSSITTKGTSVSTSVNDYVAVTSSGDLIGNDNSNLITVSDSLLSTHSQVVTNKTNTNIVTDTGTLLSSTCNDYQVKTIDVFFHSTPVVGKPVLMSVDGLVSEVEVQDAEIKSISNTTYKLTFKSDGYKTITLHLPDGKVLTKRVNVLPGFRQIVTVSGTKATCTTGDFWAIVQSPSTVKLVPPNSQVSWTEYSFGLTPISVTLVKGSRITDVQYHYCIYNSDALKIVSYGRNLQLLSLPHTEIDHVVWYLDNMFIGTSASTSVPLYIPEGTYTVQAEVYSNDQTFLLTKKVTIPRCDINRIYLSSRLIKPHLSPDSTNRMVMITNDIPEVTYQYLDSSLNIRLDRYLYTERFTYVGTVKDLTW